MPDRWNDPMRPDPFDPARSGSGMSGEREPYAYERERLITERERLRRSEEHTLNSSHLSQYRMPSSA